MLLQMQRGQTPAARFRELRLERGEKLLTNSWQSIADVAGAERKKCYAEGRG